MRVAIRVDASLNIGTGHVMRCLTLARSLRNRGSDVFFICREDVGNLCNVIESWNFHCSRLPKLPAERREVGATRDEAFQAADARQTGDAMESHGGNAELLVVDHYELDVSWESVLRPKVGRIFVIDDLANRRHECDLLLDQNFHDCPALRYSGLVPKGARVFVGPRYALLRPEFCTAPAVRRTGGLRRMLVFFGGVDPTNEALKVVRALRLLGAHAPQTDFVLGPTNVHVDSVLGAASGLPCVNMIRQTDDMAALMRDADLGVGTCGVAAWERCCVGLPSLVVVSADNQRDDARILQLMGAARNLGDAEAISVERWAQEIRTMQEDPSLLNSMSMASASVMQGRGEAMRELEDALAS